MYLNECILTVMHGSMFCNNALKHELCNMWDIMILKEAEQIRQEAIQAYCYVLF